MTAPVPRVADASDPRAALTAGPTWPVTLALVATIPAFYEELLASAAPWVGNGVYGAAALVLAATLVRDALRHRPRGAARGHRATGGWRRLRARPLDPLLAAGLAAAALLPPSHTAGWVLALRLAVAGLTLLRLVLTFGGLFTPGGLPRLLALGGALFAACGAGFWWLEPTTPTFGAGPWLAFVTAATVGYGDLVPTTPASKIFAVFVVLLGWGMLSVVTAAIAARWVQHEERAIEREILRDLHASVAELRREMAALRHEQAARAAAHDAADAAGEPAAGQRGAEPPAACSTSSPSKISDSTSSWSTPR